MSLLLKEGEKLNLKEVQIAANADNLPSNKVIQSNGGVLIRSSNGKNFYVVKSSL